MLLHNNTKLELAVNHVLIIVKTICHNCLWLNVPPVHVVINVCLCNAVASHANKKVGLSSVFPFFPVVSQKCMKAVLPYMVFRNVVKLLPRVVLLGRWGHTLCITVP